MLSLIMAQAALDSAIKTIAGQGVVGAMAFLFVWAMLSERLITGKVYQRELERRKELEAQLAAWHSLVADKILPAIEAQTRIAEARNK